MKTIISNLAWPLGAISQFPSEREDWKNAIFVRITVHGPFEKIGYSDAECVTDLDSRLEMIIFESILTTFEAGTKLS